MSAGIVQIMLRVGNAHYDCGLSVMAVPPTLGEIIHLQFPKAGVKLCGQVGWVSHSAISIDAARGGDPEYAQELYPTVEVLLNESQIEAFSAYWTEYTRRTQTSTGLSEPVGGL